MKNARTLVRTLCALFLFFFVNAAFAAEHVVQKGDTLSHIAEARKMKGGWNALWNYGSNREVVKNPNLILPGQKLSVPDTTALVAVRRDEQIIPTTPHLAKIEIPKVKAFDVSMTKVIALIPVQTVIEKITLVDLTAPVVQVQPEEEKQSAAQAASSAAPVVVVSDAASVTVQTTNDNVQARGENSPPPAQGPPEGGTPVPALVVDVKDPPQGNKIEQNSSTTQEVAPVVNPVNTVVKKTDSVHANVRPSLPATTSVVDEFNDLNVWSVVPGVTLGPAAAPVPSDAQVKVQPPAAKSASKRSSDDDFDNPNVWDSRAIDNLGRVTNTIKTKSVQSEAVAISALLLQSQGEKQ